MSSNNKPYIIPTTGNPQDRAINEAIEKAKSEGKFIDGNIWETLRKRKEEGSWDGEIETIVPKTIMNLTSGAHYYEIEDPRSRSVVCISCPIKHGGILEAHLLTRYKIDKGVIYLDGQAMTRTA